MDFENHKSIATQNLLIWHDKELLRKVYGGFYEDIKSTLTTDSMRPTVEIGSGVCGIKSVIPDCICTEAFDGPGIDIVESVYDLSSFPADSVANFILFDVFHHLEFPFVALKRLREKLHPSGRIILVEPAVSFMGLIVYGLLHREPVALLKKINTREDYDPAGKEYDYYAAQGNATRIFLGRKYKEQLREWRIRLIKQYSAISYVASGGYQRWQLYPTRFLPLFRKIDVLLDHLPALFATRLMVVLEKE